MLLMRAAASEQLHCGCRHDLFNQRLQFAFVQPSPRAYLVSKDWHLLGLKGGPGFQPTGSEPGLRRFIYR